MIVRKSVELTMEVEMVGEEYDGDITDIQIESFWMFGRDVDLKEYGNLERDIKHETSGGGW